ncbi:carbon-nitrogen hydrolase family protein [Mycoplasmatota bacterium]|nr:carbon-nitrogen hydrolase family protein [Mycoplasmatota bacterium]
MKVLVLQNTVSKKVNENLRHIQSLIQDKVGNNYDFILLPEMFMTPYELKYFKINKQKPDSQVIDTLSKIAKNFNAYLIGGSIPEASGDKIYNTSYVFNRKGKIIAKYRKIHLFSVKYPDGRYFSESEVLSPGDQIVSFHTEFGRMGLMICFDIRFPYLASAIRKLDTKVIFVPAAFNTYTGPLHWHTTFKARAIDNQMFFISASPARDSFGTYEPYGHSLVVDPFGEIIQELNESESFMEINIDLKRIKEARESIPIIQNEKDISKYNVIK